MTRKRWEAMALSALLTLVSELSGCSEDNPNEIPTNFSSGTPGKGSANPAAGPQSASNPKLKAIMTKIGKGPQSLQDSLKGALSQSQPAWETIEPMTKEYAALTSQLGTYDPPRGTKDSWAKLTQAFSESAAELNR